MTAADLPPTGAGSENPAFRKLPDAIEHALETLIHSTADALSDNPIDDPRVEDALEAVRAAVRPSLLPSEMTPEIGDVLRLMVYTTGPLAHLFRAGGAAIPKRIEDEQAFILFRFLHLALVHGAAWKKVSDLEVGAALARSKANLAEAGR